MSVNEAQRLFIHLFLVYLRALRITEAIERQVTRMCKRTKCKGSGRKHPWHNFKAGVANMLPLRKVSAALSPKQLQ
jgi:hypothetical protein